MTVGSQPARGSRRRRPCPRGQARLSWLRALGTLAFLCAMQGILSAGTLGPSLTRVVQLRHTGTRCTACHPSSFSTEANLAAHRYGYPIRSRATFQYVMDRIANSITPLYGTDDLCWQRFITIPLQAQGKQGGLLADFEREVSGRETPILERFGPFLKAAWENRLDLPQDEQNGVVPLDSKFGFAWRDWRVLDELARRTGRADYAAAAAKVASILGDRAADKRIETLQDRIHRLHAWWLIDRDRFASKIRRETGDSLPSRTPTAAGTRPTTSLDRARSIPRAISPTSCPRSVCPATIRRSPGRFATCSPSSKTSAAGSRPQRMRPFAHRCARPGTR